MTPAEIASALLVRFGADGKGWGQGALAFTEGYCCLVTGAVRECALVEERLRFYDVAERVIDCELVTWNDLPTTTWPDVKRVLEQIAGKP